MLTGKNIILRALEPMDVEVLYKWENDTRNWKVSNTLTPYSKEVLDQYIANAQLDIYAARQLRLVIQLINGNAVGCIDLFDFEPTHLRAGIGILVAENCEQQKGYASEALELLIRYGFETLYLKQLYCNISADNLASFKLFTKHGFEMIGTKKQWIRSGSSFTDEYFLQLIR